MARKAMTTLKTECAAAFPDNVSGEISPADLRTFLLDFLDTMTNGYCVTPINPQTLNLTTTPQDLGDWGAPGILTPEYSFDQLTGIVTANDDFIINFTLQLDMQFGTQRFVTVRSNFSGSGTPGVYKGRVEGAGDNDPAYLSFSGKFDGTQGETLKFTIESDGTDEVDIVDGFLLMDLGSLINEPTP